MRRVPLLRFPLAGPLLVLALLGVGCNAGWLALGLSDEDPAPAPTAAAIRGWVVESTRSSPATLRFEIVSDAGAAADVTFSYQLPGATPQPLSQLGGEGNPGAYAGSPDGTEHTLSWDFASEPEFPPNGGFVDGVTLTAELEQGGVVTPGATVDALALGNDAPRLLSLELPNLAAPGAEQSATVPLELRVSDSSSDPVSIRLEFTPSGVDDWRPLRPAGATETPDIALVDVAATPAGLVVPFEWDSIADLAGVETNVLLRATPTDPDLTGAALIGAPIALDNNAAPSVVALDAPVDDSGALAIPLRLSDAEGDPVGLVVQWRRADLEFPALPTGLGEIRELLADPLLRTAHQIAAPADAHHVGESPRAVGPQQVRPTGLGTSTLALDTADLVGRSFELVRSAAPLDLGTQWAGVPLSAPIDAAPLGDGLQALVLDESLPGTWRVQRIALATGSDFGIVAQGDGRGVGLALSPGGAEFFVAFETASGWRVRRIDLASGATLGGSGGPLSLPGELRGVAALSNRRVALTLEDQVLAVNFLDTGPRVRRVATGLDIPWGIVRDPLEHGSLLVALHGADRVVRVDTLHARVSEVALHDPAPGPQPHGLVRAPRSLALERGGARLLVLSERADGRSLVVATDLRGAHDLDGNGFADARGYVAIEPPGQSEPGWSGLVTGANGLRLLIERQANTLWAVGGIEQRRPIVAVDVASGTLELETALAPPLLPPADEARTWRISSARTSRPTQPSGHTATFAWDTSDLARGGEFQLRVAPFDGSGNAQGDLGAFATTDVFNVRATIGREAHKLFEVSGQPLPCDLDGDGDLDLLAFRGAASRVSLQTGPRTFEAPASTLDALGITLGGSLAVAPLAVDVNADGHVDLVHLRDATTLEIYHGQRGSAAFAPLTLFDPTPVTIAVPAADPAGPPTDGHLTASDVDVDGDLDLVLALAVDGASVPLWVWRQNPSGAFAPPLAVNGGGSFFNPRFVECADVDGNGFLDLIAAHAGLAGDGRVAVHFQNTPGVFAPTPADFGPTTRGARSIAVVDADGDGDLDVAVSHGPAAPTGSGAGGSGGSGFAGVVTLHLQGAPRVFDSEPLVLAPPASSTTELFGLRTADLDHNGAADLVAAAPTALLAFLALEGGNGFDPEALVLPHPPLPLDPALPLPEPGLADLDGDGDVDFVHRGAVGGGCELRYSSKRGFVSFSAPPLDLGAGGGAPINDALGADLDGDGRQDVASAVGALGGPADHFAVHTQMRPRVFSPVPTVLAGGPTVSFDEPRALEAVDVDGDGDRDLVGITGDRQLVLFRRELDTFAPPETFTPFGPVPGGAPNVNGLSSVFAGDIDLDGDLEVLTHADTFEALVGFGSDASGVFTELVRIEHDLTGGAGSGMGSPAGDVHAADLDRDGDVELLLATSAGTAAPGTGRLLVFDGLGGLDFEETPTELEAGFRSILTRDVDGDGDTDIVTQDSTGVVLLLRVGDDYATQRIEFVPPQFGGGPGAVHGVQLVDGDRDGDLDLFALCDAGLCVLEQVAPAVFAPHPPRANITGTSLRVIDLDGDGELDLLAPNALVPTGRLHVFWGNG